MYPLMFESLGFYCIWKTYVCGHRKKQKMGRFQEVPQSEKIAYSSIYSHSTIPVRRVPSCQVPRFPFLHHIFQSVQKSPCVEKTTLQLLPGFCNKANTDNRISGACLYISKHWDCQESVQVVTGVATDDRL